MLKQAMETQYLDYDSLRKMQFGKLTQLLNHAYQNVPFYREKYDSVGVKPGDIRSWEEFYSLPLVTKEDIRSRTKDFLSQNPRQSAFAVRTGGSTGKPMLYYMDQQAAAASHVDMIRSRRWWGIELGDREVKFWGHGASFAPGLKGVVQKKIIRPFTDTIMNRQTLSAYNMSSDSMMDYWKFIQAYHPQYIVGYASTLYVFAHFLREMGINGKKIGLKACVSAAEILYDWQRMEIEEVFGCAVANEYGATEVGIIGYGCPCGAIHTMDEHVIVEVVKKSPEDEFGDVLITHFENWYSPLIRYNLEDVAIRENDKTPCIHGIGLSRLKKVLGRQHDLIRLSDGRVVHGEFFTHIFDHLKGVEQFQVVQKQPDFFEIAIVPVSEKLTSEQEGYIRSMVFKHLGKVEVRLNYQSWIEKEDSAKFRWVRSEGEQI